MYENSKQSPGLLRLCEAAVGSGRGGCSNASTRLSSELSPFISHCPGHPFEKAQVNSCASKQPRRCYLVPHLPRAPRRCRDAEGGPGSVRAALEQWTLCLQCSVLDSCTQTEPAFPSGAQEGVSHACAHASPSPQACQGDAPLRDQGTGSGPAALSPLLRLAERPAGAEG